MLTLDLSKPNVVRNNLVASAVFLVIGAGCLGFTAWWYLHERAFLAHSIHTRGKVVDVESVRDKKYHFTVYNPTYSFTDTTGKAQTVFDRAESDHPFEIGTTIPVVYNPDNPADAQVERPSTFFSLLGLAWVPGAFGVFFSVGALLVAGQCWLTIHASRPRDRDPAILSGP